MSTPVEQYVPEEFQDELDLPDPVDPSAAKAVRAQLRGEEKGERALLKQIELLKTRVRELDAKGDKAKGAKLRKTLQQKESQLRKQLEKLRTQRSASIKRQDTLQKRIYEVSGEYEKLLTGEHRDAYAALKGLFNSYGLGSLAGKIYDYVKNGYGADTIAILLQDTKEYKERFKGNEARTKAGLAVLSPQEYLATEAAYRQILNAAGLPKGFYDNPADFAGWIGGDVSPTEIQKRVDQAVAWTSQADPATLQALKSMYGVDAAYVTAYALDRTRALPLLQKQARAAEIGAAAIRRGLAASRTDFENLATYGITGEQAEEGFGRIKDSYESLQAIAGRFGLNWDYQEAQQEVFTPGVGTGFEKGKRLRSQERALFSGNRGSSVQGLNAGYSQT